MYSTSYPNTKNPYIEGLPVRSSVVFAVFTRYHRLAPASEKGTNHGKSKRLHNDPARESPLVLDCAHNRDSAIKLRKALDEYFPGKPVVLVFGASEDKDIQGMLDALMPRVERMVAVKSFHPRSIETETLNRYAEKYGKPVSVVPDVAEAVFEALRMVDANGMVLVTGSIFVAAGARIAWLNRSHE